MFSWFNNISIATRTMIGIFVPVLGLLLFSGVAMKEKYDAAQEIGKIHEMANLAPTLSAVVHEMQKERGRSAGFIGSGGRTFADILPEQREKTDQAIAGLQAAIDSFDFSTFPNTLGSQASEAIEKLGKLGQARSAVDSFELTVPQMAKYYTGSIVGLLEVIEGMGLVSSDDVISKEILGYTSFLQGKERAGRERAMGAAGFGAGTFNPAVYNNFIRLIGEQDLFFDSFLRHSNPQIESFYNETMTGAVNDEVERLRAIASSSLESGTLEGTTAGHWFQSITDKINLMKQVEDRVALDLQEVATNQEEKAWQSFQIYAGTTICLIIISVLLGWFVVRSITVPVGKLTTVMHDLAGGNHSIDVYGANRKDEIGKMAKAVEVFKMNAIEMVRIEAEAAAQREAAERERKQSLETMADDLERSVGQVAEAVSTASADLHSSATAMSATAEETTAQASAVSTASEQATSNVNMVAAATEELSSSVGEISRQVSQSSEITKKAVDEAARTTETVQTMLEMSDKVGNVINLISDIAEQTNLLALNATIEAARAGEAGKGFAVVASEVKSLANQTAKATEEISSQISRMQSITNDTTRAIESISSTINDVNEIATGIASAVEEQGAATNEISRNIQEAAKGTQEVSSNITGVTQAAGDSGAAANQVLASSSGLSAQAQALRD
ncbi:MAG: nitrate- and nitrite sensing domain-containing protein, partial [Pseudomonadota bacterium]